MPQKQDNGPLVVRQMLLCCSVVVHIPQHSFNSLSVCYSITHLYQGCRSLLLCNQATRENQSDYVVYMYTGPFYVIVRVILQSTISMHSILMLGSLGTCAPRKILKNRCSEIECESISESKYYIMCINFKSENNYDDMMSQDSSLAINIISYGMEICKLLKANQSSYLGQLAGYPATSYRLATWLIS